MTEQTVHTKVRQSRVRTTVKNAETVVEGEAAAAVVEDNVPAGQVTRVVYAGRPGRDGVDGTDGAPGTSGGSYVHSQNLASDVWTIPQSEHNLAFTPNVTVVDSAGTSVEGEVAYLAGGTVQITFASAFGGTAYLS